MKRNNFIKALSSEQLCVLVADIPVPAGARAGLLSSAPRAA